MRRLLPPIVLGLLCGLPFTAARGEIFLLANGGRLEGEWLNRDESPRKSYLVRTELGVQLTLAKNQIESIHVQSDAEKRYEEVVRKMPDTVEGQLSMAEWCRHHELRAKRQFHLEQVIARAPDHAAARAALGFTKIDGRWLSSDDYMTSQGYVRHQGRWRLKQDVAAEVAADKLKKDVAAWKQKLRVMRTRYEKKGDGAALAEMRAINDPIASIAFADLLGSDEGRSNKLLYIEMLGKLPTPAGISALVRQALDDDDDNIREACLRELALIGRAQAVGAFLKTLGSKDNVLINRAGAGLGALGQTESVPPLIEALVTQHKQQSSGGGGGGLGQLTPSFSSGGGGGLSAGGNKPKIVIHDIANESVLGALRAITKEDFRFDKAAWRAWWADSRTPKDVNLRRRDE